jgi:dienelactone hydrolase/ribosomal protein S18 acetylase RimI-like enzyme
MTLSEEIIEYRDRETELAGVVVSDDSDTPRPGILVVHGGAGLEEHAKRRARQFAELGLLAFACDMYGKAVTGDRERVMSCIQELVADRGKVARRAQAGVEVLASHPALDGKIAAVGYCFGGRAVLELARSGAHLAGAISVHGSLQTANPASPGAVKAKVLVCHGALDPHVPSKQLTGFIEEMDAAGADYQLIVYGGAMHGFTHDVGPQGQGVAYHAPSAQRSFQAITALLSEAFGSSPRGERGAAEGTVDPVAIRAACEADTDFVSGFVSTLLEFGSPAWSDAKALASGYADVLASAVRVQDPRSAVLIAERKDGRRLGFISLRVRDDGTGVERGHVADLGVVQDARRLGVGSALMTAGEAWARERGFPVMSLDLWATNERARAFYEALGYSAESLSLFKRLD